MLSLTNLPVIAPAPAVSSSVTSADVLRILGERFDELELKFQGLPAMLTKIKANTVRILELERQNLALRSDVDELRQAHLTAQAELRPSAVMHAEPEVIISGVPCSEAEGTLPTVTSVLEAINCPLTEGDIISLRFLVSQTRARSDAPWPIIVKLRTLAVSARIINAKRAKGRLYTADLPSPPAGHASIININEALPSSLHKLLIAVRTEAKARGSKYVWHLDVVILARRDNGMPIKQIRSIDKFSVLGSD